MSIGKFFSTFGHVIGWPIHFVKVVIHSQKSKEIVAEINLYVPQAMLLAALFATATKTDRDDDAIEAANEIFQKYDIQVNDFLELSDEDKDAAVLAAAQKALQHELPDVKVDVVFSAVRLAMTMWNANGKPQLQPDTQ